MDKSFINTIDLILLEDINYKTIINKIRNYILDGSSRLKKPLKDGEISVKQIIKATQNGRCLRSSDRDFGSTYLETMLSNAIDATIDLSIINTVRIKFGLSKLSRKQLVKLAADRKSQK